MAALEALVWGYGLIEGPCCDEQGNLFFSDVPNGGVYRLARDGSVETAIPKRRGVGGIALHSDGGLVVSGRNICHVTDGQTRILFAPEAMGLNDLTVDHAGRVICGTLRSNPFAQDVKRVPGECWRIDSADKATEIYGDVSLTNGIGLSPDGSVLYHCDTAVNGVWAHDYADGTASGRRFLVRRDDLSPDGLAVDEAGTVWVADISGSCSVRGFSPSGAEVGRIEVPARAVTSLCFGGSDRRDLYIVTADNRRDEDRGGTVFHTRAEVPGCRISLATV